ncbi:MAG: prepilin-type N-terminal cleavage/methylation domain-containing protein [Planctomycetes bacterium]|nr:prepilin-type N-terminal cleavage/methylation domain-containing protein [Planctomycetota bacterium]
MNSNKGFTLVEILIVVIILGILAAIVIPQFSNASQAARASTLAEDLRVSRTQLAVYMAQHGGVPPSYPPDRSPPTAEMFVAQMTMATNELGETQPIGTPGFRYGPYWREAPSNPVNLKNTVAILGDGEDLPAEASDEFGWIYQPGTLTFLADSVGQDSNGKSYIEY